MSDTNFKMKGTLCILLLGLAVAQALVPKRMVLGQNGIHPKKTLKEWQELVEKTKYVPPSPRVRGIFPQPASSGKILTPRIIGGDAAQEGQFPWQVSVIIDDMYFCGGSLLSDGWVLTAGHCVVDGQTWVIRAGSLKPQSGGQSVETSGGILHEGYDDYTLENDIGVVQISGINLGGNVNSVKLPSRDIGDLVGTTARVSGWGLTSDNAGSISPVLNYVDLNIVDVNTCLAYYGGVPKTIICIDTTNGKSSCNGDSGGPLVIQGDDGIWTEVGVVSFGSIEGCEVGAPAGFTRVSEYLDWISEKTGLRI